MLATSQTLNVVSSLFLCLSTNDALTLLTNCLLLASSSSTPLSVCVCLCHPPGLDESMGSNSDSSGSGGLGTIMLPATRWFIQMKW